MPQFFWVVLVIVIISTVVGAVAKMLNNMNELNAQRPRPPARPEGGGGGGTSMLIRVIVPSRARGVVDTGAPRVVHHRAAAGITITVPPRSAQRSTSF